MKQILVLGSLNIDLVQRVPRLPVLGETLRGEALTTFVGGKGANQACAAARLGGNVRMAGCVGNDVFGERLTAELQAAGADTSFVRVLQSASGSATIFVLPGGENTIVISPGANGEVGAELARAAVDSLGEGDLLLCQLEIPLETVVLAMRTAHAKGVVTMLDPAPAAELPGELYPALSILTPNQTEAAMLAREAEAPETMDEARKVAIALQSRGVRTVIVKMGAKGCLIADGGDTYIQPGFPVKAVDTTAAGDTFNGALAVALAQGRPLFQAARYANAAAALSVTKPGALSSIPAQDEVQQLLAAHS